MKKQLILLVMIMLPLVASADAVEIDGIYYNLIPKGKIAEVTSNPYDYTGNVIIPQTVTYESVNYSVTGIEGSAFYYCSYLTSVTIPNSVTSIGDNAFYFCKKLTSVTIPNSVTSIGKTAFYQCSNLLSVHISDLEAWCKISFSDDYSNPLYYAHHLFINGEEIKDLVIPKSVTSIGSYAFSGCSGLTSVTIPNNVTSIRQSAFSGCSGLTSLTIPNSVTSIGNSVFYGCSGLTSVTIPNSITIISNSAFAKCTNLLSVTIPNSVTEIWPCAFIYCSSLTSVTIPNNVTGIGQSAFYDCSSLTSVTIGSGIKNILVKTFASCPQLTNVYCHAVNVPITYTDTFEGSYIEHATLHVPSESVNAYKVADPWKNFKNTVPLGNYYEFTINVGNNGKVEYNSQVITGSSNTFYVGEGANASLTIIPDNGYQIATLTVNGVDAMGQLNNDVLTISNVTANTTVAVTFEAIPGYVVNIKMAVASGDRTAIGYSSANGLDFTNVTDMKAWVVTGFMDDATVLLSRVKIVPPNTGLYLTSDVAGVEVDVPTTDRDVYYMNMLLAAVNEETINPTEIRNGVEYTNFVVGKLNSGEMGFVRVKNTRTLGPNKSRLLVPSSYYPVSNQAPELQVTFTEDASTTDLRSIDVTQPSDSHVFDLQGRKLSVGQAQKGLYIYKGKKYVIK